MVGRERRVAELEAGDLDYLLTVDIFNEGVDIPRINQVVMLRQTQSAIVFVQQLGRGLRLAQGKDYLVVIDVIGNYTNNFLIPIALFGDESLNRESLRERLNETAEGGALPGLASVSFDEVSRERILRSIVDTKLDSMRNLKVALEAISNRVGGVPKLWDF
jgi:superfamily II DNA or RNA helicase